MSFLKKMFGKRDPLEEIQQLYAARDWAAVLAVGRRIDLETLDEETRGAVEGWQAEAGDHLAKVNLEEGDYARQTGSLIKAREHYQLAAEQARDEALRQQLAEKMAGLDSGEAPAVETPDASHASCGSGCGPTCGPAEALAEDESADLDAESRLELLLATYPPEQAARYAAAEPSFQKAWLAVQDGEDELARSLFAQVPEGARDALYRAELGSLLMRNDQLEDAIRELQQALAVEPDLFVAFDPLVAILLGAGPRAHDDLVKLLKQKISEDLFVGYCWARLAEVHAQRREAEPALAAGLKALDEGVQDQGVLMLCAQLLEQGERFDEAEGLLMRLPSGGCGGGAHPMLAEFWLRREKNLDIALESFKAALRQERDNPRWMLRIAQTYQGKGWKKEASQQLEALMARNDLPQELRNELVAATEKLPG